MKKLSDESLKVAARSVGILMSSARSRAGLTQDELAEMTGLNQSAISFIELGKPVGNVTNAKLSGLFGVLGIPSEGRQALFILWWRDHGH